MLQAQWNTENQLSARKLYSQLECFCFFVREVELRSGSRMLEGIDRFRVWGIWDDFYYTFVFKCNKKECTKHVTGKSFYIILVPFYRQCRVNYIRMIHRREIIIFNDSFYSYPPNLCLYSFSRLLIAVNIRPRSRYVCMGHVTMFWRLLLDARFLKGFRKTITNQMADYYMNIPWLPERTW